MYALFVQWSDFTLTTYLNRAANSTPRLLALRLESGSTTVSEDAVAVVHLNP